MPVQYLKLDPPDPCATHTFACDQAHINVEHINQDELDILCYVLAEVCLLYTSPSPRD